MTSINIRTWNIDWFRHAKRSGAAGEYDVADCNIDIYKKIVEETKMFLTKEKSIVFMQEVPYKIKLADKWVECNFHKMLYTDFPSDEYEIAENVNKVVTRCTIAVFKKSTFLRSNSYKPCNNRTIGLIVDDITVLGVHMPTNFKKGDSNHHMWSELIEYTANNQKIIIAGDFNAYIGCNDKMTETKYIDLCRKANDIVSDDTPTYIGKTPIDHIFLNFDTKQNYYVEIEQDWQYSDHKYVQVELQF